MSDIHVRHFGAGPDRALMLHCSLAHGGVWKPVAQAFEQQLSTHSPDMPGHGRSRPWDGQGDIHDDVMAGLRPLLDQPMHLVGHSFGGTLALRLAQERPELVRSLTLVEPVLFAAARGSEAFAAYRSELQPFLKAVEARDWPIMAEVFHGMWGDGSDWSSLPAKMRETMIAQMPMIAASEPSLTEDIHGMLHPDRMARLTMAVTLLRGGASQPIVADIHATLRAALPQAHEITVAEAGHMLPISHPEQVISALRGQLENIPA